jgi:hypothetical protein
MNGRVTSIRELNEEYRAVEIIIVVRPSESDNFDSEFRELDSLHMGHIELRQ